MIAPRGPRGPSLEREAVARAYGPDQADERLSTLEGIGGLWGDRDDLGSTAGSYLARFAASHGVELGDALVAAAAAHLAMHTAHLDVPYRVPGEYPQKGGTDGDGDQEDRGGD